jgi:pyrimidine-nucleoside phosphorylase
MRPQDIICIKRDGGELSPEHIKLFIDGVCDSSWADYQIAALLMAMFTRGLNEQEGETLVREMLNSGEILDFSTISAAKADKHSTGGVGDKCSLVIAPLVASCGIAVPMISGRGLGHTGGTLDKLESIPGYNVKLTKDEFHSVIDKCGFAMAGQTAEIAPADKKLYALRDATATIPYIPLIVASIMSKKLAEGLDALVLDVKTGSGAFMASHDDAVKLAEALVATGKRFNVKTQAAITDMSQPLGKYVGNSVEVYECIKILRNEAEPAARPTWDLALELSARMLVLSGVSANIDAAKQTCTAKIKNGEALERFRLNIECQGGDPSVCDDPEKLLSKEIAELPVKAEMSGFLKAVDTQALGNAVSEIGGGRVKADDRVDHAVGYSSEIKLGDAVKASDEIGVLYCRDAEKAAKAAAKIRDAYSIGEVNIEPPLLIRKIIE